MDVFAQSLFWFIVALLFALIEIQSEGKYGWAEKMPTWYRVRGFIPKIYGLMMGGKPLTGYHLFMFFLPVMIMHAGFVLGAPWTLQKELQVIALYFIWCPVWDYLWFVLNPFYTASGFKKDTVWWHAGSPWIFGLFPLDYLVGLLLSFGFAAAADYFSPTKWEMLLFHLLTVLSLLGLTALTIFLSPFYHRWHGKMLDTDERDQASIFHKR